MARVATGWIALVGLALPLTAAGEEPDRAVVEAMLEEPAGGQGDWSVHARVLVEVAREHAAGVEGELAVWRLARLWPALPDPCGLVEDLAAYRKGAEARRPLGAFRAARLECELRVRRNEDQEARALARSQRVARFWRVLGPLGDRGIGSYDRVWMPEERRGPEQSVRDRGETRSWRDLPPCDPRVPEVVMRGEPGRGYVYAVARFRSPAGIFFLHVRSPAPYKVWVDGVLLRDADHYRGEHPVQALAGVQLEEGEHEVLLKMPSEQVVAVRLLDAGGHPAGDVEWVEELAGAVGASTAGARVPPHEPGDWWLPSALREWLAGSPEDPVRLAALAMALQVEGEGDEALERLEAAHGGGGGPGVSLLYAGELLGTRYLPRAVAFWRAQSVLQGIQEVQPEVSWATVLLSRLAEEQDRPREARELLEGALRRGDAGWGVSLALAELYDRQGWTEEALIQYRKLHEERPEDPEVVSALADLARERRNELQAREWLQELCRLEPGATGPQQALAEDARRRGDLEEARRRLTALRDREPWSDRDRDLVELSRQEDDWAGVLAGLDRLRERYPRDPDLLAERGDALMLAGRKEEAEADYRRALELEPGLHEVREYLSYLDGTETDRAAPYFTPVEEILAEAPGREAYPRSATILLCDEAVLTIRADGSSTTDTYQARKVLNESGVERTASVVPRGELIEARTLLPDGRKLEPIVVSRELQMPAVSEGSVVEVRHRDHHRSQDGRVEAYHFFFQDFDFEEPFYLSRLVAIVEDGVDLKIKELHFDGEKEVTRIPGATVYRWEVRHSAKMESEPFMPPYPEVLPSVRLETVRPWPEVFSQLRGSDVATDPSRAVERKARELVEGSGIDSELDQARELYGFVNEHVEHDGPEPPPVALVARRGRRDDLFVALARAVGLDAAYVAVGPDPTLDPEQELEYPDARLFSGTVVGVWTGDGGVTYLDFSSRFLPFGALRSGVRGSLGYRVEKGEGELLTIPRGEAGRDDGEITLEVRIRADGQADVSGRLELGGASGASVHESLHAVEAERRRQILVAFLGQSLPGTDLDQVSTPGLGEPGRPFVLEFAGRSSGFVERSGPVWRVALGVRPLNLTRQYVGETDREFDFMFPSDSAGRTVMRFELEEGLTWDSLPDAVYAVSTAGHYQLRFRMVDAGVLEVAREYELSRCRVEPARYPDFAAFAQKVDQADSTQLHVRPAGSNGE